MMLYVSNLAPDVTEEDLQEKFEAVGTVISVKVIRSFTEGTSRGFGFVRMSDGAESENAIRVLDGELLHGKVLSVSKARTGHDRRCAERRRRDRRIGQAGSHWRDSDYRRGSRRRIDRRKNERRQGFRDTGRTRGK